MRSKSPYSKFLKWCATECLHIQDALAITEYRVSFAVEPSVFNTPNTAFEISTEYPYKDALICWDTDTVKLWKNSPEEITRSLLHEMLHLVVHPLLNVAEKRYATESECREAVEHVVDHLTNVLLSSFSK